MDTTGWFPWVPYRLGPQQVPYSYRQVQMMRDGWDNAIVADPNGLAPEMNVADLWWKPVGEMKPEVNITFPYGGTSEPSALHTILGVGRLI